MNQLLSQVEQLAKYFSSLIGNIDIYTQTNTELLS